MDNFSVLKILKENILLESGIKMPPNTKSARVIAHSDTDGVFSAILTRAQLEKQGIPKERIQIEFAQYGDDEKELYNKLLGKKNQLISVVDFAALPRGNVFKSANAVFNYKIDKVKFVDFIIEYKKEFKNMSEEEFKNKFMAFFKLKKEDLNSKGESNIGKAYRAFKSFDFNKFSGEKINWKTIEDDFETRLNLPDFVSDHHDNTKDDLSGGKSGKIGATEYKSDTEHLATVHAQNLADSSTIKAISLIDSAGYTDLENTIFLKKNFKEKGRMERLATILNTLMSDLIKSNPNIAKEVIINSQPSLVSVYNNVLKYGKYNDTQMKIYSEMNKEEPDWTLIKGMVEGLPKRLQKGAYEKESYKKLRPLKSLEEWRKKGEEDIAKALSGYWSKKMEETYQETKKSGKEKEKALKDFIEASDRERKDLGRAKKADPQDVVDKRNALVALVEKKKQELEELKATNISVLGPMEKERESRKGKFVKTGVVMAQDASSTKDHPSRFLSSLLEKNGQKAPFVLKRFGTFIQVALNPDAPKEVKETVDLGALSRQILDELQAEFRNKGINNDWAMEIVKRESGGHKAITNISGLGTIGLMPSKDRQRLEDLENIKSRAKKVGMKFDDKMPAKSEELKNLQTKKEEAAKTREEAMNFITKRFYEILWQKYHGVKIPGTGKYELKQ